MNLDFFSKHDVKISNQSRRQRHWGWLVGLGLGLCAGPGIAQEPAPLNSLLLQLPAPDAKPVVDEKAPAVASEPKVEEEPAPQPSLQARAGKYSEQIAKLRRLKESLINAPTTTERIDLQIEALTNLIQAEAQELLDVAATQSDPAERDRQLKDLVSNRLYAGTPAAEEAGDILQKRNVDGKLYPDVAAADAAREKIEAQDETDQEKAEQTATAELEKLADPDLKADLQRALENLANERLQEIRRLAPGQQVCKLREFINDFPGTRAAVLAEQWIALRNQVTEQVGQAKLVQAMRAPLRYDQRWRRLKELVRDLPQTSAAVEAQSLLNQHATTLPTTTIWNHWSGTIRLSVETLYDGETVHRLQPGESVEVPLMFPALLRVSINDEVEPLRIFPGNTIGLHPRPSVSSAGYSTRRW